MLLICVACALVYAAFLDGACATDRLGPWDQDAFYFGLCHTKHAGYRTRRMLIVPETMIPSDQRDYDFLIPDKCKPLGMDLVGAVVTVCDTDAWPILTLRTVTQGSVRRMSKATAEATCNIKVYCT